jgi:protein-L-isoaspartate(D-aspartate) O-methyltransferase
MSSLQFYREAYARCVVEASGASDACLIAAFAKVPREDFVGPAPWSILHGGHTAQQTSDPRLLYQDVLVALARDRGINNGQPSLHAMCLAAVRPAPGEAVLHIGAGTGYYSAILAELVGSTGTVLAYEIEADLAEQARANLRPWVQCQVRHASATAGALPASDVVYVNASATHPPAAWLSAMRAGARMVLPLTPSHASGVMLMLTRPSDETAQTSSVYPARVLCGVSFIPCVGAQDPQAGEALARALHTRPSAQVRSLHLASAPDASAWCVGPGWWLSTEPM